MQYNGMGYAWVTEDGVVQIIITFPKSMAARKMSQVDTLFGPRRDKPVSFATEIG